MDNKFKSHAFSVKQQEISDLVRHTGSVFNRLLYAIPDCRERQIAEVKLEECVMWANKAIALNGGKIK